ncbi:hypothetical protein OPT61_g3670 [Boeremia exigua]|uniref:Uncharacterized protein n=1 Tax=Boeremia exigua TaxID=749465 RepID=A0ACC2IH17_9PLEO|nr:hypothetical protein OPT61_g3670 [Boeremia exigua]
MRLAQCVSTCQYERALVVGAALLPQKRLFEVLQLSIDVRLCQPRPRPVEASTPKPKASQSVAPICCSAQEECPRAAAAAATSLASEAASVFEDVTLKPTNRTAQSRNVVCSLALSLQPSLGRTHSWV